MNSKDFVLSYIPDARFTNCNAGPSTCDGSFCVISVISVDGVRISICDANTENEAWEKLAVVLRNILKSKLENLSQELINQVLSKYS